MEKTIELIEVYYDSINTMTLVFRNGKLVESPRRYKHWKNKSIKFVTDQLIKQDIKHDRLERTKC